MSEPKNLGVIREVYAAFGAGDIPRLLTSVSPDVVWEEPETAGVPWAGTRRGRDGVEDFFRVVAEAAEVEVFEPRAFVAAGDRVVVLGFERLRIRATDRTYEAHWAHAFTLRDGEIAHFREYADTAAVATAFGRGEGPE